ncbi:MAG: apolipoprotein N-acyltransferase [Candidatus Zapsychrus exili]|nr:apolipoprotein N-acyltransferase [Candidatus Zapsychrus exili]
MKLFLKFLKSKNCMLTILSAVLLCLAFPKTDIWFLSWVSLIPLFYALDDKSRKDSFKIAYFCGIVFFVLVFYWLTNVTFVGATLLVLYFALYFGLFAICYSSFKAKNLFLKILFLSSVWVVLEYARAYLFTGFGWASLGYSQYKNLHIIQIADITGVYGISFLIIAVNVLLKGLVDIFLKWCRAPKRNLRVPGATILSCFVVVALLAATFLYGNYRLNNTIESTGKLKIAVVQPNTKLTNIWQESLWPKIVEEHIDLTLKAMNDSPDLIIWPETSVPAIFPDEEKFVNEVKNLSNNIKVPILFGSVTREGQDYFNSAILTTKYGEIKEKYNKLHLVAYGEYIPFRSAFPFLKYIVPIDDFTSGSEFTTFSLEGGGLFSVLICFEDTIETISRGFVLSGAELLINITNDAWFGDSKEPFMHLSSSVLRAVENRKYVVRSANTGLSSFINSSGNILNNVKNNSNKMTYIKGYATLNVDLNQKKTIYTKFGDVFTYLCFGCILLCALMKIKRRI